MIEINEVAVILYDDLPEGYDLRDNLFDFTEFKLFGQHQLHVYPTKELSNALAESVSKGYKWAVVVAVGNLLHSQTLVFEIVKHAQQQGAPLACHILDRGGYYHLHPQFLALDLAVWNTIGRPAFEYTDEPVDLHTRKTERCSDNAHDDYTPLWLKPAADEPADYHSDHGYIGIQVIAELIKQGYSITNIPDNIRQRKNYCYPHHNYDEIKLILQDKTYEPKDVALWWFNKSVKSLTDNLYQGYYVTNTEQLTHDHRLESMKFDCFIGVCGGLKPACIVGADNFADHAKVYLYDISPAALDWQRFLFAEWNGDFGNFETVFNQFQHLNNSYKPLYFNHISIDENINWFLDNAKITRQEFTQRWKKYQNARVEFVTLDLLQEGVEDQMRSMIANSELGAYVWTSNAFFMDYLMFYKTRKWTDVRTEEFSRRLLTNTTVPTVLENCNSLRYSTDV